MTEKGQRCPLLQKYYIPPLKRTLEEWQTKLCLYCPLEPLGYCVEDKRGRLNKFEIELLENAAIGCPKCQSDPIVAQEIRNGDRLSTLEKSEDGWKCWTCCLIIYRDKPIDKISKGAK